MAETIESIPVPRAKPTRSAPQGLFLDKAYDECVEPRVAGEALAS
jgi:hypothetical protein